MPRWYSLLVVVVALALAPPCWAAAQSTPVASPSPSPQPTALLVFTAQDPMWVAASDGKTHVVYDLVMTNIFMSPVTIESIDVLSVSGAPLLRLAGDELQAVTRPVFGDTPTRTAPLSGAIVTLIDLPLPPAEAPQRLTHRVTYALEPDAPDAALLSSRVVEGPEAILVDRSPQVISPPLRGGGWVNVNGCCAASPHRTLRLVVDGSQIKTIQMFAVDWAKLQDGALYAGDGAHNADYFGFGEDLLAVADGRVVSVRDDLADHAPYQPPALQEPGDLFGNQIVLEIASGVYAIYAHVQQGSALVRAGDTVQAGDVLGKPGNSGSSASPHLHFQLSDGPDPMTATSLPFVIDAWTLEGTITPESGAVSMEANGLSGPQSHTLPLASTIASFAE
ncbi:MAG: M23 family metallopeptidase [Thermomicrobiales bacterium]|nr:M23 family metallopeptidase [Thermomicrobiales bacterium]